MTQKLSVVSRPLPHVPPIPEEYVRKWQKTVDIVSKVFAVPASLIVRAHPKELEVLVASQSSENPFTPLARSATGQGRYCETVIATREPLLIPDARESARWSASPELKYDMVAYFGLPVLLPSGEVFGSLCVLDRRSRDYPLELQSTLWQFRELLEHDLLTIQQHYELKLGNIRVMEELSRRETQQRLILDNLPGLVASFDGEFRCLTANRALLDMVGTKRGDEVCGRHVSEVFGQAIWAQFQPFMQRAVGGERVTCDVCLSFPSGARHVQATFVPEVFPGRSVDRFYGLMTDVHDRKIAEDAQQESVERLGLMLGAVHGGGWDWNIATGAVFYSEQWLASMGFGVDDWEPTVDFWWSLVHPDDVGAVRQAITEYLDGRAAAYRSEQRLRAKSGHYRWVLHVGKVVSRTSDGQPLRMVGVDMDITERKASEVRLRQSEENLRTTLHSIGDAVMATDIHGYVTQINPIAEHLTGWPMAEALGRPLHEVFHVFDSKTRVVIANPVEKVLATGETVGLAKHTLLIARDGTEYHIADSGAPIRSEAGEILGVVLVFRDETDDHALQEQLRHTEKISAIGRLAGGVAHDLNNMLAGIVGAADLLMGRAETLGDASVQHYVDVIMRASTQAGDLTSKLLAFGRKGNVTFVPVDLHQVVDDVAMILQRTLDKKITVNHLKHSQRAVTLGDDATLQNALLNLGINAGQAMPEGGCLTFETRETSLDCLYCETSPFELAEGPYVELEIRDNGCGIPGEHLSKIFEPFFTTKRQGEGTGLGLAAVYGTIQEHRGAIVVDSRLGEGTSFRVFLPSTSQPVDASPPNAAGTVGAKRILFVDDEELVRMTCGHMLKEMGHEVVVACDGREAVDIYRREHDTIDLVIMDMVMPVMNGRDAFTAMRQVNGNCRAVIASGFASHGMLDELRKSGLLGVIRKPFRYHELNQLLCDTWR